MNSTDLTTTAQPSDRPSFGDELTEFLPFVAAVVVLAPITLLSLVLWAPFLLVLALVAAPALAVGLVAAGVATLAMPFVYLRHRHQRAAERQSPKRVAAVPTTFRSPLSGLIEQTTVGGAR